MHSKKIWAVNSKFDTVFLMASLLAPFVFAASYFSFQPWLKTHYEIAPEIIFFLIFTGLFDAPHILQTFLRSHFDNNERTKRKHFHLYALIGAFLLTLITYYFLAGSMFIFLLGLFGGWHIVRQSMGFLKVYQSKEQKKNHHILEIFFLYYTWIYFLINESNSVKEILPKAWIASWPYFVFNSFMLLIWGLLLLKILKQNKNSFPSYKNTPKLVFLLGTGCSFMILSFLKVPYLFMVALATITHTIQYHGWMHRFQTLYLDKASFTTLFYYSTWLVGVFIVFDPIGVFPGLTDIQGNLFISLAVLYNALVLWHYFIDGHIWRFSKNPELKKMIQ